MLIAAAAEDFAEGYVAAYADATQIDPAEIMAWVPLVAAARLMHENADADERARLLAMIAATLD